MMNISETILHLAADRGPDKSICPSDAARALADDWRPLLKQVREAAVGLARAGQLQILRKGRPVENLDDIGGVIRLRLPPR